MTFSARSLGLARRLVGQAPILVPVTTTSRRALHGAEQHVVAAALEEQLRAGAGHDEPTEIEVGVVRPALAERQVPVQLEGIPRHAPGHPHGQVALVRVSGGDALPDVGDPVGMLLTVVHVGCHCAVPGVRTSVGRAGSSGGTGIGSSQIPNQASGIPMGVDECTASCGSSPAAAS